MSSHQLVRVFVAVPPSSPLSSEVRSRLLVLQDLNENFYWSSSGINAVLAVESVDNIPGKIGDKQVEILLIE
jgi:hypothetical protein